MSKCACGPQYDGRNHEWSIEKCPHCIEREAAAQEEIKTLRAATMVIPQMSMQILEVHRALARCREAGWETEG